MKKKYFFSAMMSAIALTGTLSLIACSSDDEVAVEDNPTYEIVCERNKKATKKNSYRNLTIDNMEIFIRNSQCECRL